MKEFGETSGKNHSESDKVQKVRSKSRCPRMSEGKVFDLTRQPADENVLAERSEEN